ncbi:alpha/beta hydrolase family protein [Saccharopolyspora pogona]|uniref:hypothetical protein n=1 Tax=Saccharopolyspora pogona TaxID=333966 RepID=UPI0016888978|nr:hypothetical protein [Saccharopolyspora pogona]
MADWQPKPIIGRTLLVRATQPMPGAIADPTGMLDWRPEWPYEHEVVDVPGDHLTVLEDHAETTAQAVRDWLQSFDNGS